MIKFVGGYNYIAVSKFSKIIYDKSMIPIIDYAKECSKNENEVIKYDIELQNLVNNMNKSYPKRDVAYSLKISSYLPYETESYLNKIIKKINNTKHTKKYIFLDAEQSSLKNKEDYYFNKIIEKYQEEDDLYIYKTYQMYRKNSLKELENDIKNFDKIGIKLVRGAYYNNKDTELFNNKIDTDYSYNNGIEYLINNNIDNVVLATHNSESIDYSISLNAKNNIMYAQLLGMGDNISNNLVKKNKKVFKYVPYGNIFELYPYLLRRLYENMDMIKHFK
tara:strand:+ start:7645 stop:8475 length:831 start_codon:yes stop_codon:yes gene_type:complete